ncbi:MAG: acyl-CoA thioesterase [Betaproteobacteria bacterium]|jgi:acyl-CoA thioester hydrolase|nr:acyl-CoA thioesterase [Betaproteobacteria bacterium]MCC6247918.1 acyl-CoA thioesterase [Rubrivivax sp.]MCL4695615.1 acyl-CoA thioesterase [Burkholderiaceae bacterium]
MRFVLPDQKKLVHEMIVPIRWGDMDAMGHVNNTIYFRYFEVARLDWFFGVAAPHGITAASGEGVIIVNAFCNFIRQLEYPGEVRTRMYTADVGRSSFDTFLTMERTDEPGVVYAEGGATTVWCEFAAKKSKPMPDWMRAIVS